MALVRGFEIVSKFTNAYDGNELEGYIPKRKTEKSAGYDIQALYDKSEGDFTCADLYEDSITIYPGQTVIIGTGIKAYMQDDEFLGVHIRSGLAFKESLVMVNSTGIIDADYYNNEDNEGEIFIGLKNTSDSRIVEIKKGDRIAQGIFYKYLKADEDNATGVRKSGIGSTGK